MVAPALVAKVALNQVPWQQLQPLLDVCYQRPPRDVFERMVAASHHRQRLWLASDGDGVVGLVMLTPHTNGGHLDNLAVAPRARGCGIGHRLVQALLQSVCEQGPSMVSLTTRIPNFFAPFGFQPYGQLADGSTAMLLLLPNPALADLLKP
jgi:ribosomal protein S18 acetylase RimI-like enzyme